MARGRPPSINPARSLNTHLDERLMAQLDILLFSPLEGRIPKGAYQRFFEALLRRSFDEKELDLAPFVGALPGEHVIRAAPETLAILTQQLTSQGTNT